MRPPRHARGFSLLELVVVVIAVAVLAGFALDRLLPLIGRAQRAAFLDVQRELQSALLLEAAQRITRGESHTLPALAGSNPMNLLLSAPANYVGSVAAPAEGEIPPASWYFDEELRLLGYRVGRYTRFAPKDGPRDRIELRVAFAFADRDGDGRFDAVRDRFDGLRLASLHAYEWPD